jgi:hypothetical protein
LGAAAMQHEIPQWVKSVSPVEPCAVRFFQVQTYRRPRAAAGWLFQAGFTSALLSAGTINARLGLDTMADDVVNNLLNRFYED